MFNSKKDVSDEQNERHKRILTLLMKQEGNKHCADCKTRNPTWASVNLGVFVCLTCSGIHRSLGVHISQVRSCNLDTWLPRQVEFMKHMGNVKASGYWEAQLPSSFRRPPSGNPNPELAQFIRAKYEERRYAAPDVPPPNIDNYMEHAYVTGDKAASGPQAAAPPAAAAAPGRALPGATAAAAPPPSAPKAAATDLMGFEAEFDELAAPRAATAAAATSSPVAVPAAPSAAADPFSSLSDDWSDFASAAPVHAPAASSASAPVVASLAATTAASPTSSPLAAAAAGGASRDATADPFASLPGHDLIASMQATSISTPSTAPAPQQQQQPPPAHAQRPAARSAEDIMKLFDKPGGARLTDPFSSPTRHSGSPTAHLRHAHAASYSSAPNLNGSSNGAAALPAGAFMQQAPGYVMPQQQAYGAQQQPQQQGYGVLQTQHGHLAPQLHGGALQPPQAYGAGAAKGPQVGMQPALVAPVSGGNATHNFNFTQF